MGFVDAAFPAITIAGFAEGAFTWVVVPLLLVALVGFSFYLASLATTSRQRASNIMALVLGIVLFITVFALHRYATVFDFSSVEDSWSDWWKFLGIGLAVGLGLLYVIDSYVSARSSALFIVLILTGSLSALYFYFADEASRTMILLTVLGMLVGAIFYALMFNDVLEKLQLIEPEHGRSRR